MPGSDVQAAIAAGRVPSTVAAEYLDQTRDPATIIVISVIFGLTTVILAGRIWARATILKRFGLDDALAILAWALLASFVGLCYKLILIGSGRHYDYIQYVMTPQVVEISEVYDFVAHIIYTTSLLACRLSGLALYAALVKQNYWYILGIKIVAAFIIVSYIPQLFLIIFHCMPVTGLWPYSWQLPAVNNYTCLAWGIVYSVNSAVSLCNDLLLYGIPAIMIWRLQMTRRRKIQLACILCPGVLVIGISVARLISVIKGQWDADESWEYDPLLAIEVAEISFTLVSLSVPGCKLIFEKHVRKHDIPTTGAANTYGYNAKASNHDERGAVRLGSLEGRSLVYSRNGELLSPHVPDGASAASTDEIMVKTEYTVESLARHPQRGAIGSAF